MNKVLSMIVPLNQGFKYCPISISFFFFGRYESYKFSNNLDFS